MVGYRVPFLEGGVGGGHTAGCSTSLVSLHPPDSINFHIKTTSDFRGSRGGCFTFMIQVSQIVIDSFGSFNETGYCRLMDHTLTPPPRSSDPPPPSYKSLTPEGQMRALKNTKRCDGAHRGLRPVKPADNDFSMGSLTPPPLHFMALP